ncbi:MAG: 2-C-methyl-D-erythritol 4-phosphate cytidylyltransferase [bacterium]|nr:2-C-methyl-D-erythritol 4-phosphate cytidylyltransferase [bacterium]
MTTQLVIPAAGMGVRLGSDSPKALVDLAGRPLLSHTLDRFRSQGLAEGAIVIVPPGRESQFRDALGDTFPDAGLTFVPGGAERQQSVENGLAVLDPGCEVVVIHDAARPFVAPSSIQASIACAREHGAATVAIPSADTILVGDDDAFLVDTPDRRALWACQTPQTFRVSVIREAHARANAEGFEGTDDASLVRRAGAPVKLVMGTPLNFKITTPGDLALAHAALEGGLV